MLMETTKNLSVSAGAPGPASCSHQPSSSPCPPGHVGAARQGVLHEMALEPSVVERPPGFVGEGDVGQESAGLELKVADADVLDCAILRCHR